jgi:hypothetical protein
MKESVIEAVAVWSKSVEGQWCYCRLRDAVRGFRRHYGINQRIPGYGAQSISKALVEHCGWARQDYMVCPPWDAEGMRLMRPTVRPDT